MGTNFYVEEEPTCDNPAHTLTLHIGKSSGGWLFGFHAIPEKGLTSWLAWREFLKVAEAHDRVIKDEYGRVQTLDWFTDLVEGKQRHEGRSPDKPNISRMDLAKRRDRDIWGPYFTEPDPEREWSDPDGYDFYAGEFS